MPCHVCSNLFVVLRDIESNCLWIRDSVQFGHCIIARRVPPIVGDEGGGRVQPHMFCCSSTVYHLTLELPHLHRLFIN